MKHELSMTNESFNFLKNSSEFLNLVLNNINSCVLLLDKGLYLQAFNNPLKTIFSNKQDEDLLYVKCGEAIGCAYQVEEQVECGSTSKCKTCELRIAALKTLSNDKIIYKEHISKPFFTYQNQRIDKHLQFSTRIFRYKKEKYVMMIIEDITKFVELENAINAMSKQAGLSLN